MIKADLYGALARGYCSEKNSKKTVDQDLIEAMADEIMLLLNAFNWWIAIRKPFE